MPITHGDTSVVGVVLLEQVQTCWPTGYLLPEASTDSQYIRKGNIYSKRSPEANNRPFYKGLQLV
jgi:hypothetical protein